MKLSMRLLSEFGEVVSSWARPITLKEALAVTTSIGSALVLINQWVSSVQLSAHDKETAAAMQSEFAGLKAHIKAELAEMKVQTKAEWADTKIQMKAEWADLKIELGGVKHEIVAMKATMDEVLRRLPTPTNR